jgi:nitrile hydratase accessory protein
MTQTLPSELQATLAEVLAHCKTMAHPPALNDGPVFAEPWQAQAFATTVALHRQGVFTWPEWAQALSAAIARAQAQGGHDDGTDYYHHWLAALEQMVQDKGLARADQLHALAHAWEDAALATPHGQPIELPAHQLSALSGD